MITSKFFTTEENHENEIISDIFRYKVFYKKDVRIFSERFPIYVVLKNKSIEFNFQGKIKTNHNTPDYFYSTAPILSIPLSSYAETENEVKRIFNRNISIKPYFNKDEKATKTCYDYSFSSVSQPSLSYSNLTEFGFKIEENWSLIKWEEELVLKKSFRSKFLRRLLLDFLDDFFNANVFMQSPRYELIKERLLNSFILKGIYYKAEFYLRKELFEEDSKDILAQSRYFIALDKWTDFITDEKYKHLFASEKKTLDPEAWFDFSDYEVAQPLIFNKTFSFNDHSLKKIIANRSVTYLVKHYEIAKATFLTLTSWSFIPVFLIVLVTFVLFYWLHNVFAEAHTQNDYNSFVSSHFLFYIVPGLVILPVGMYLILGKIHIKSRTLNCLEKNKERKKKEKRNTGLIRFVISLFNLIFEFLNITLILTAIIVFCIWLIHCNGTTALLKSQWTWLVVYLIIAFFWGCIFFVVSFFFRPAVNLLLPRLQMAVITAWIAILSSLDFWKNSFDISISNSLLFCVFLITFTASYLWFEIKRNIHLNDRPKLLWKVLNVIIPGYILSLTIGMGGMSLLVNKYMTHTDFFENKVVRENIFELKNYDSLKGNYQENLGKLKDSVLLFPKYSVDTNRITTFWSKKVYNDSFEIPKLIYGNKDNPRLYELHLVNVDGSKSFQHVAYIYKINLPIFGKHNLIVLPGFLILMSAAALFSGIFLTLLFDDKPVTDPL